MSTDHIILCPGQGAQRLGMGKAWFDSCPLSSQTFGAADAILGDTLGAPLSTLCFEGPLETLNRTDVAQPALYTCAVASYQAWINDDDDAMCAAAGLSLGEYTALHLAGALSFEDGLRLVALRGKAMQDASQAVDSSMVALIGANEEQAKQVCQSVVGDRTDLILVPANFNAPGQVVLSGHTEACDLAVDQAGALGLRAAKLSVAGAFHSPLMQSAADRLETALDSVNIVAPSCPVLSNVTGEPHTGDPTDIGATIKANLVAQLTSPVLWEADCHWLADHATGDYHELAPGKVLAGLMRRINRSTKVTTHDTPQ